MGVDGTGSGSCPVSGSATTGVEPAGSATRELIIQLTRTRAVVRIFLRSVRLLLITANVVPS
jgi:hypothetical protein